MRILIISFFTDWTTHLGVELELAQNHLDAGDEVVLLSCDGGIKACRANPDGNALTCNFCRYRRMRGIPTLSAPIKEYQIGDYISIDMLNMAEAQSIRVRTIDDAKEFRHAGHDLGWGALSSTISELRDPLCASELASEMLTKFTRTAILSYEAVLSFLKQHGFFDRAYIFNGRHTCVRGAFRACKMTPKMKVILHERGSSNDKYALFENELLHSKRMWQQQIERSWESEADSNLKYEVGSRFYEERRSGTPVGWLSFTGRQNPSLLPEGWDQSKTNIVIFNSSEDEFAAIGDEWKNHVYPMQSEGVRRIVEDCRNRYPDFQIYLRMHPNLIGVENEDVIRLRSIQSSNFHYIAPDSKISSYALLDAADKVVSFGSSVGIEANFWGKPSIMAGHSFYEHLGAVYCPNTHEEVMDLIGQDLAALPKDGAIKYAYHLRTFGTEFKHWRARDFFSGSFKGRDLSAPIGKFHQSIFSLGKVSSRLLRFMALLEHLLTVIKKGKTCIFRIMRRLRAST